MPAPASCSITRARCAGRDFVTRKVTLGLARVALGHEEMVHVGNLEARRDWGFAGEYVEGMWMMLQREAPGDYVLATGRSSSVRDFIDGAATGLGFDIEWTGNGIDARAVDRRSGHTVVAVDPKLYRPAEVDVLIGDARKAKVDLGWEAKTSLEGLIQMMVQADYDRVKTGIIRC
jgi:GDPmannose 4,6-dehydratase